MNGETNGGRSLRTAAALAVAAAVAVLATGCGVVHVHFGSSAQPASYQENLAYAQCMRSHGVPDFPLPNPAGNTSYNAQVSGNSAAAQANAACKHLLSG